MIKVILLATLACVFATDSDQHLRNYLLPFVRAYNSLRNAQDGKFGTLQSASCTAYEYATLNTTALSTFCAGTCSKWLSDNSLSDINDCINNNKLAKCTEFINSCATLTTLFASESCSSYSSKTTCCADTKCKWEVPDTSSDGTSSVTAALSFICLKSDNSFCLPTLLQADGKGECTADTSDATSKLDKLCGGCLQGILGLIQDPKTAREIKLICTKDQGRYCFLDLASNPDAFVETIKVPSKLRTACAGACPPNMMVTQAAQFNYPNITTPAQQTSYDKLAQIGNFICTKENGNSYCLADIQEFLNNITNCTCSVDCCGSCTINQCPSGCNKTGNVCDFNTTVGCSKLNTLVQSAGTCCLGAFAELVGIGDEMKGELDLCGIKGYTGKCQASQKIAKSVKVNGKCDLFNKNKDAYTKAITRDLESGIGCIGCVKDIVFACANTSSSKMNIMADQTQVNFNIQGATNSQNSQLSTRADSVISSGVNAAETTALVNKDTKAVTTASPSPSPSQTTNSTFKSSAKTAVYQSSFLFIIPTLYSLLFL